MKRVIFNSTTIMHDGSVMVQLKKQQSDDGITWDDLGYHRITLPPAGNFDAALPANDLHLKQMGFEAGLDARDVARCKAHIALAASDVVPVSDSLAMARIATESARLMEIDAANRIIKQQAEQLQYAKDAVTSQADAIVTLQNRISAITVLSAA